MSADGWEELLGDVQPWEAVDMSKRRAKRKGRSKYNNKRVKADGYTFDSKAEYRRYQELVLLRDAGAIKELRVHPCYTLLPKFTDSAGNKHRAITYEADFSYRDNGADVVEDVKGVETPVFKIKKKLLLHKYPELVFRQINVRK